MTKLDPPEAFRIHPSLGSGLGDRGFGIAVDASGAAYVTGRAQSATFPGVNTSSIQQANSGSPDVFVTKSTPSGTAIVYSTFLGGADNDAGSGIAVDLAGAAYITGGTNSATFPGVGRELHPIR